MKNVKMKSITKANLKGKKVLVRIDINCSVKNGKIIENPRIKASAETIKYLKKKGAKVVLVAHQGSKGKSDLISLKQHARLLNNYVKIDFVNEVIGNKAWEKINRLNPGESLLLENVRFLEDEFDSRLKGNEIVEFMKEVGFDYYVNDAFSVSHRKQTSVVSFPKLFKSLIGLNMEKELESLDKLKALSKEAAYVLGGVKIKDVSLLLNKERVLTTGRVCLVALKARGYKLGLEDESISKEEIKLVKKYAKKLEVPVDLAIKVNGKRKEVFVSELPVNAKILDIGKKTVEIYSQEISGAEVVFFKGAPGKIEEKGFDFGTKKLLKSIAKSKGFSVVAGGSSADALKDLGINKNKIGYVSLSGGALVHYLAGKKLPGVEVLK